MVPVPARPLTARPGDHGQVPQRGRSGSGRGRTERELPEATGGNELAELLDLPVTSGRDGFDPRAPAGVQPRRHLPARQGTRWVPAPADVSGSRAAPERGTDRWPGPALDRGTAGARLARLARRGS